MNHRLDNLQIYITWYVSYVGYYWRTLNIITRSDFFSLYAQNQIKLKDISLFLMKCGAG